MLIGLRIQDENGPDGP